MRLALARASVQHYSLPNITYGQLENQHATGPLETYNAEGKGNFFETYATAVVVNGDWARISSILWNSLITDETTSNDIEDIYPTRHTWVGGGGANEHGRTTSEEHPRQTPKPHLEKLSSRRRRQFDTTHRKDGHTCLAHMHSGTPVSLRGATSSPDRTNRTGGKSAAPPPEQLETEQSP